MLRALAPLALLLAVTLTGCGDDDSQPATTSGSADAGGAAAGVITEVTAVAPALESYYRGDPYPQTVEEAVASLDPAGVELASGTEVGAYTYDADAVEFVLCLQDQDGAWASYDTAPMGVRDSGTEGGCPQQ